jgi:branched-chain amino acid transport system substrate-binding protein
MFITDINSLGLKIAQNMYLTEGLLLGPQCRNTCVVEALLTNSNKRMPTMVQAGVYSSTMHYLKAVKAAGTDEATGGDGQDEGNADQRLLRQEWAHP